jgi:hypothetical protein
MRINSNAVRRCPKWMGSKVPPKIPIVVMMLELEP